MSDQDIIDQFRQINTNAAAKFLDLTPRKLELMRQHGDGPVYVRVSPKCIRYRIKELLAFQEANLKRSTMDK